VEKAGLKNEEETTSERGDCQETESGRQRCRRAYKSAWDPFSAKRRALDIEKTWQEENGDCQETVGNAAGGTASDPRLL